MSVTVPAGLRHAVVDDDGGQEWLDSIPARAARAVERWDLVLGEPFETGMAGWTAPATTAAGADVVLKLSYPHSEARDEAAALAAWHGAGAVEMVGADADDWALLLHRLRPGSTLGTSISRLWSTSPSARSYCAGWRRSQSPRVSRSRTSSR